MSEQNRPDFPIVNHYDGDLVDAVNIAYECLTGSPKYATWINSDEGGSTPLPFGIVGLHDATAGCHSATPVQGLRPSWRLLAHLMQSALPVTPVTTKEEKMLFSRLLRRAIAEKWNLGAMSTFVRMAKIWNEEHTNIPNSIDSSTRIVVFPKYPEYLSRYYKQWRISQLKKSATKKALNSDIVKALQYNAGIVVPATFQAQPLHKRIDSTNNTNEQKEDDLTSNNNQDEDQVECARQAAASDDAQNEEENENGTPSHNNEKDSTEDQEERTEQAAASIGAAHQTQETHQDKPQTSQFNTPQLQQPRPFFHPYAPAAMFSPAIMMPQLPIPLHSPYAFSFQSLQQNYMAPIPNSIHEQQLHKPPKKKRARKTCRVCGDPKCNRVFNRKDYCGP